MASVEKQYSEHDMLTFAGFIAEEFNLTNIDKVYYQFVLFIQMQKTGQKLFEHLNNIEQDKKRKAKDAQDNIYHQQMTKMVELMKQKELEKQKIQHKMERDNYKWSEIFNRYDEWTNKF